jgi:SIR2-like domain
MSGIHEYVPRELLDDIRRGECVPVIGAGFSLNARLPAGCRMPVWDDLGTAVAARMNADTTGSPLRDLSRYCDSRGRFELVRMLWDSLHVRRAKPGPAHLEFARLPFKHVITTNFDFLLERAYYACDKSCIPVVDEDLMTFGRTDGETQLIKMHGDLHHPSLLVLTEEDYDKFREQRERMFHTVMHLLIDNTVLFIGYSIDDPDFRQIWQTVKGHFKEFRRPAYAIAVGATADTVGDYRRRGVTHVISLPQGRAGYGSMLAKMFREIEVYLGGAAPRSTRHSVKPR